MYYLKYRPKKIDDLDNSNVKDEIKKILQTKNLPHAFLFVGQKGTGKTSTARIIAKSLNCLANQFANQSNSIEPCNRCSNCLAIDNFSFSDVLEMDAASNRGIEEVKNLIKETSFLPMSGRFRIFIIDEAHMITSDGFNALLKTLEEPPKTAIFILATTNLEKVPKTIQSRCFKINFGQAKKKDIFSMLKKINEKENLQLEEEVLSLIADFSENSFRDASKILEEVVIQKIKTKEELENFLGIKGKNNFFKIIEEKNEEKTLAWLNEFALNGGNFKNLIEVTLNELHFKLLLKKQVIKEEKEETKLTLDEITKLIKLLIEAYSLLKISPIESLPLEIALIEFYNQFKLKKTS